jgi:hypothetical protein
MVQRRWVIPGVAGVMALSLRTRATLAFAPPMVVTPPRRTVPIKATVDPNDVFHAQPHFEALLSTLYADVLKPAQEHTQPLWGPPDPVLSAMTSIVPSPNAFHDAGLTAPAVDIPEQITETLRMKTKGMNVIDPASVLQFDGTLPGFKVTGHVLPQHSAVPESPQSLILEMGSIAKMMRVVNSLPMAAFLYACAEFFLVTPGYDVYKEELEEDRPGAAVEFLTLSGLRLGILSVIGLFTLGLFDK